MSEHDAVVRMLKTERIAIDGLNSRLYKVGEIVHLPQALADALIRDHIATEKLHAEEPKTEAKPEPKPVAPLPLAHEPKREYEAPVEATPVKFDAKKK